ncbi:hypothetical protein L1049_006656 [Liquidambar formosana]|uniref:CCT domain-containing protein n=1 Tax=Liquidambar formosana TaxID=63359 RepID=A0AAP0WRA0_LIQFO
MSSDLFLFDDSFFHHSSPEIASSDMDLHFFSDPLSPFSDTLFDDILRAFPDDPNNQNPVDESHSLDQIAHTLLSSSPPSHQMENLSLCPTTHVQPLANCSNSSSGFTDFTGLNGLEVKIEECQVGFGSSSAPSFPPHSFSGFDNAAKMMQRTYSSNSFDGKPGFFFQPRFNIPMGPPNFQTHLMNSPENSFPDSHIRRVCSTGDLQNTYTAQTSHRSFSSPLATESSFMEDANFKVGRYSAEERKERIHKYRAKRTQRNFNKTIKYACRKTLADNRPRIRGRFARNDETGEIPKAPCSIKDDYDEDDPWVDGMHEEDEQRTVRRRGGPFLSGFGPAQFQYYGFG